MKITSHQARQVRFTARGPGYDQSEVDDFCAHVGSTLARYEELVHHMEAIDAVRHDAERDATATLQAAEQEALAIKLRAEREVIDLRARVLVLEAEAAERAADVHAAASEADRPSDSVGGDDVSSQRAAASAEAARLLAAAVTEGEVLVAAARRRAAEVSTSLDEDIAAANKRLARLRTAVRDIEARFRGLVGSTLEELSLVGDLIALETTSLTDAVLLVSETDPADETADEQSAPPGFYEKRLAGLRSRIRDNNS